MAEERRIEQLTLREMFTDAERLTREVGEHLEQGFCPRVQQAWHLVRPTPSGLPAANVEDVTVRNHAAGVLESDGFTDQLFKSLERYFIAIDASVARVVGES